jgi:formylglycine-generating enzyme required for sulfatase activity
LRLRGYKFRLPTEAQWEYAFRAGTETAYHFGNKLSGDKANYDCSIRLDKDDEDDERSYLDRTSMVGGYPPNTWGLYDMHGSVAEYCEDSYDEKFYSSGYIKDPVNIQKDKDNRRVVRGGGGGAAPTTAALHPAAGTSPQVTTSGRACVPPSDWMTRGPGFRQPALPPGFRRPTAAKKTDAERLHPRLYLPHPSRSFTTLETRCDAPHKAP